MSDFIFLGMAEAVDLNKDQCSRYGGAFAVRDYGLLGSALAMPTATFGGEFLHQTIWEMAAAYAFHICRDHPFMDGNKRTGLACALVFLELNGIGLEDPNDALFGAMMGIASGTLDKHGLAKILEGLPRAP